MLCSFLEQRRDHLCILIAFVETDHAFVLISSIEKDRLYERSFVYSDIISIPCCFLALRRNPVYILILFVERNHLYEGSFVYSDIISIREVGGWGRDPFSRNFMKPTPRRKWYLTTGRRFH